MKAASKKRSGDVLGARALNRALLERQLLLDRVTWSPVRTIEHLVGLQAQVPNSPYLALWTRLDRFALDDLTALIRKRRVVRIALMRSTIHMVTARDCLALRPTLQSVQDRALEGTFGRRLAGLDLEELATASRALVEAEPRTFSEIGTHLAEKWPTRDRLALSMAARTLLALVQVPPRGVWGESGAAAHTTADMWMGKPLATDCSLDRIILRYLAAFGPSTVADLKAWSGWTALREVIERLRPRLRVFHDTHGRELFDLPNAPRPDPDTPAPPRFLPEYDNVLLAHADRARIVSPGNRARLFASGGLLLGTILVDGFVSGRWKMTSGRGKTTLVIQPSAPLRSADRAALTEEGRRLLQFVAADVDRHDVRFTPAT